MNLIREEGSTQKARGVHASRARRAPSGIPSTFDRVIGKISIVDGLLGVITVLRAAISIFRWPNKFHEIVYARSLPP